jgi:hypothetical protein
MRSEKVKRGKTLSDECGGAKQAASTMADGIALHKRTIPRRTILSHNKAKRSISVTHAKGDRPMDDTKPTSAAERYEACRVIDEGCSRAMAACVDMIDAVSAIGVRNELHAVRDALQRLHAAATATHDEAARIRMN